MGRRWVPVTNPELAREVRWEDFKVLSPKAIQLFVRYEPYLDEGNVRLASKANGTDFLFGLRNRLDGSKMREPGLPASPTGRSPRCG